MKHVSMKILPSLLLNFNDIHYNNYIFIQNDINVYLLFNVNKQIVILNNVFEHLLLLNVFTI